MNISEQPVWGSMPDRQWDTTVWVAATEKIRTALAWQPRHTVEQGFIKMVEWFSTNDALRKFYRERASAG
jgi:dTDP-D-glucose 4,6-dehydratase